MTLALSLLSQIRALGLSGRGASGLVAPSGFVLLLGADGTQLTGADGAPLYGVAP